MNLTEIKFNTKDGIFEPDRMTGSLENFKKLGIEVLGKPSIESIIWDYEGVNVKLPDKTFMSIIYMDQGEDGDWCGDVYLVDENGETIITFGYVENTDFEIISGHNPFGKIEKKMQVINFISGPGAGKSTLCSGLFSFMKRNFHDVEFVHEYAKELTWDERFNCLQDQLSILGHQNNMMHRLKGKVDWVVTDTCLVLGLLYAPDDYFKNFEPLLMEVFNSYENINIFVERPDTYEPIGRNQTHEEAIEVDKKTLALLDRLNVKYIKVKYDIEPKDLLMAIRRYTGW